MSDDEDNEGSELPTRILSIDDNDFYQSLNIRHNAGQTEIRENYKRRALEWHPGRNIGSSVNTTQLFQALRRTYENLSNETKKQEYDQTSDMDRDDDANLFQMGPQPSDIYRQKLDEYTANYDSFIFDDNFSTKINDIFRKFQTSNPPIRDVNHYIQCDTCYQSSSDQYAHQRRNVQPYEQFFNDLKPLTLIEAIDPSIWHWQPVKITTFYLSLWNNTQRWNQMKTMIDKIQKPVDIVRLGSHNGYWAVYIERYRNEKEALSSLPEKLSMTRPVDVLPSPNEIKQLKSIFDQYDQNNEQDVLSKFKLTDDQRTATGNKYCLIDPLTKHKCIDVNDFYFPIQDPPAWKAEASNCRGCQSPFKLFYRRHTCRMCAEQHCSDCLSFKRIPHLGFIVKPVRICFRCSMKKENLIYERLMTYVKQLIATNRLERLAMYLALVYEYKNIGDETFYRETGNQFYSLKRYSLALQCFIYARISDNEWFQYAQDLCAMNEYSYAFTCMNCCQHGEHFWLDQVSRTDQVALVVLCSARSKLTAQQFFDIITKIDPCDQEKCMFFILYMNDKYQGAGLNWKKLATNFLLSPTSNARHGDLLMFMFSLHGRLSIDDWTQLAEQLSGSEQYEKLAYLLSYLYDQRLVISTLTDGYIHCFSKILFTRITGLIALDHWLDEVCLSKDIGLITIALSFIHAYQYTSWETYKHSYIEQKQYYKALLCHKMVAELSMSPDKDDMSWFINGIEDENCIAFELHHGLNSPDWQALGDRYFDETKYTVALNCYLNCDKHQTNDIILRQAEKSFPASLLYYIVVYKRLSGNNPKMLSKDKSVLCNNTFYDICKLLSTHKDGYLQRLLVSAIQSYDSNATNSMFKNAYLFKFHLLLLTELEKTNINGQHDQLINGGVHTLMSFENVPDQSIQRLIALQKPLLYKLNVGVYDELKAATCKSSEEFMEVLLNPDYYYIEQLKNVYHQCLGQIELEELQPMNYRAKMYLIRAMISKLDNKPIESSQILHQALLTRPSDDLIKSIIIFVNHSCFHPTLRAALIDEITLNSFNLTDLDPPIVSMYLDFLQPTNRLRMLRKYERAIFKRLAETDPAQTAMSYIDLNAAVQGDSTSYASNLILACLFFYKAMNLPNTSVAESFAYRSIISDIVVELFLLARNYLPLYAQMYIYRVSLPLILRSNELFKKQWIANKRFLSRAGRTQQLIIDDYQELLITEMMTNLVQISKVTPFTHVPMSSAYDLIYYNCVGNEFLSIYLKQMTDHSPLYRYYFFEGIWKGWIRDEDFDEQRIRCMQALLADRHFNLEDVENLLHWSLLPRTVDGWLWSNKHRLELAEPAYSRVVGMTFNKDTGEMEFLFKEATNNEHNLFDMNDVIEVLTNGITGAAFTLDPPSLEYHSHPFSEMKYVPKRLSSASNYLQTLLHADYLLKMISTTTEVCAQSPFEMRSADEALMRRLPSHIVNELKAILGEKHLDIRGDSIHRYWIEADKVSYEMKFHRGFFGLGKVNEHIQKFCISDELKMTVRKHRMRYDELGDLIDDENDLDNDQSPEAKLARVFTKYYDEIGEYFPELLRLKELLKLGALSMFMQTFYEQAKAFISAVEDETALSDMLTRIRSTFARFPTGNKEFDEKIVSELATRLSKEFYCRKSDVKGHIINYFTHGNQQPLVQFVKQSLIQRKTKLKTTMDKMNIYVKSNHPEDQNDCTAEFSNDPSKCPWVPAVFTRNETGAFRVYGGVNNLLQFHEIANITPPKGIQTIDAQKSFQKVMRQQQQPSGRAASKGASAVRGGGDDNDNDREKGDKKGSINQLKKRVEEGNAPKEILRVEKGNPNQSEKDHVHFKDGSALNIDGTWKHKGIAADSSKMFTKHVKKMLLAYGFKLPDGIDS